MLGALASWDLHSNCNCGGVHHHGGLHHSRLHHGGGHSHSGVHHRGHGGRGLVPLGNAESLQLSSASTNKQTTSSMSSNLFAFQLFSDDFITHRTAQPWHLAASLPTDVPTRRRGSHCGIAQPVLRIGDASHQLFLQADIRHMPLCGCETESPCCRWWIPHTLPSRSRPASQCSGSSPQRHQECSNII